jgi:eukaryotic-like serine/threonine-protein kinase
LADRYTIERELGAGGMATVYLAQDLKHDRQVAIKVLKPELAAVLGAERFVVEIKTTAALQHPHILPLFDSGSADGFLFYVMPYVQGETLRTRLDRETQLGIEEAVRITRDVADALDYAHRHGVIHRDIKPENILLHDGRPMVADFGIALAVSAAAGGRMTETGMSLGTPHYMSPEQATADKEITGRSDIYSLGSVLYEMLAGNPPHVGSSAQQIIMKIIAEPVEPVTKYRKSVPPNVAAAVAKSLEKLPADRFESAKAFGEALGNPAYTNASGAGAFAGGRGDGARAFKRAFIAMSVVAAAAIAVPLWDRLKPAPQPVVSRNRIVLWENQQLPMTRVGRGVGISPDGATVVFVDSTAAGAQLFVKERDRLDATALAGTIGARGSPTFSPDGAWIAFVSIDGKLKKVPRLGGSAISLADSLNTTFGGTVAWLDGGTILFTDRSYNVKTVSEDGGASRMVLAGAGDAFTVNAVGLPGGHTVLLGVCTFSCASSDLRVLDLRASPAKASVREQQVIKAWPLPGGGVAFVRRDGGVFAAPFDLGTLKFTRRPTPVMEGVRTTGGAVDMVMSGNGTVIYVPGINVASNPYEPVWVTRAGAVTLVDSGWNLTFKPNSSKGLALSPDGSRAALSIDRPGSALRDIWIKQLDHGPLTRLTFEDDNTAPMWTPDGHWVAYVAGTANSESVVRRRRADGSGSMEPLFSPQQQRIDLVEPTRDTSVFLLQVDRPSRDIVLRHRGDTSVTPLVADSSYAEQIPELSPDGRWLAYMSNESGRSEVYVRPFPKVGDGKWQVSRSGGSEPRWSRSGRELFYRNFADTLIAVTVAPGASFVAGREVALFDVRRFANRFSTWFYDVAPDDKRFLFLRPVSQPGPAGPDKLVQITNWAAEVHAKLAEKVPK